MIRSVSFTMVVSSCPAGDRKSTRLNSSHSQISYAVFCLKKKKKTATDTHLIYNHTQLHTTHHPHDSAQAFQYSHHYQRIILHIDLCLPPLHTLAHTKSDYAVAHDQHIGSFRL